MRFDKDGVHETADDQRVAWWVKYQKATYYTKGRHDAFISAAELVRSKKAIGEELGTEELVEWFYDLAEEELDQ